MYKLLFLALFLMILVVTRAPVQTCSCPDPAAINAIFERDMRGEVRLDQQTIDFLNGLEVQQ